MIEPFLLFGSIAGTAILSLIAGRAWGRRALSTLPPARALVDEVCDAVADGQISVEEAGQIIFSVQAVITAAGEQAE